MDIMELLIKTTQMGASDLHITVGAPPIIRINGELVGLDETILTADNVEVLVKQLLDSKHLKLSDINKQLDLSFSISGFGRFRVNIFKQRGSYSAAFRTVMNRIPSREELGLLPVIEDLCRKQRGLILVTGPTGSGKSTTLAYMINLINQERKCHIITL